MQSIEEEGGVVSGYNKKLVEKNCFKQSSFSDNRRNPTKHTCCSSAFVQSSSKEYCISGGPVNTFFVRAPIVPIDAVFPATTLSTAMKFCKYKICYMNWLIKARNIAYQISKIKKLNKKIFNIYFFFSSLYVVSQKIFKGQVLI